MKKIVLVVFSLFMLGCNLEYEITDAPISDCYIGDIFLNSNIYHVSKYSVTSKNIKYKYLEHEQGLYICHPCYVDDYYLLGVN